MKKNVFLAIASLMFGSLFVIVSTQPANAACPSPTYNVTKSVSGPVYNNVVALNYQTLKKTALRALVRANLTRASAYNVSYNVTASIPACDGYSTGSGAANGTYTAPAGTYTSSAQAWGRGKRNLKLVRARANALRAAEGINYTTSVSSGNANNFGVPPSLYSQAANNAYSSRVILTPRNGGVITPPVTYYPMPTQDQVENEFVRLLNIERNAPDPKYTLAAGTTYPVFASAGPVTRSVSLNGSAQVLADAQAEKGYIFHYDQLDGRTTTPQTAPYTDWLSYYRAASCTSNGGSGYGEIVTAVPNVNDSTPTAENATKIAKYILDAYKSSEPHYKIMMGRTYGKIGSAVTPKATGTSGHSWTYFSAKQFCGATVD